MHTHACNTCMYVGLKSLIYLCQVLLDAGNENHKQSHTGLHAPNARKHDSDQGYAHTHTCLTPYHFSRSQTGTRHKDNYRMSVMYTSTETVQPHTQTNCDLTFLLHSLFDVKAKMGRCDLHSPTVGHLW